MIRNLMNTLRYVMFSQNLGIKNIQGTTSKFAPTYQDILFVNNYKSVLSSYGSIRGFVFGDGDTPVSVDDFKLSGNVISGIAGSCTWNVNGNTATCNILITNNNEDQITIREFALYGYCGSTWSSSSNNCIYDRVVLTNPLTIDANGVGQVIYTLSFNFNS